MKELYPIVIRDQDGLLFFIKSPHDLNNLLEPVDVEYGEYKAWDLYGYPVKIVLNQNEIDVLPTKDLPEHKLLSDYIVKFAGLPEENIVFPIQISIWEPQFKRRMEEIVYQHSFKSVLLRIWKQLKSILHEK